MIKIYIFLVLVVTTHDFASSKRKRTRDGIACAGNLYQSSPAIDKKITITISLNNDEAHQS